VTINEDREGMTESTQALRITKQRNFNV